MKPLGPSRGVLGMKGRKHTVEQIISKLREAELALAKGQPVGKVGRKLGISASPRSPG